MAFVDDPNQNSEAPVAGPAPLSQSAAPMAEQQTSENTSQQAASGLSGSSQPESQPKGINKGRTATKASSGMFNNINKYVEKNKPQAQKIASAVSQDFNKKAQEIQKSATQQQQQQQQAVDANQRTLDENRRFAQDQISQVMNPTAAPVAETVTESTETAETTETQPVVYNPSQEAADRFQELMKGNVEGINATQNLDLSKQKNKAGALQQLADTSETEQGRRNMLGELFRKQGDYSRGMSGLDNLITSGDSQARESLIQGVKDEASGLTSGLQDMQTEAGSAKMAQDLSIANFGKDISQLSTTERSILDGQMQQALDDEILSRQGLTDSYGQAISGADTYLAAQKEALSGTNYGNTVQSLVEDAYKKAGVRESDARGTNLESFAEALKQGNRVDNLGRGSRVVMTSDGPKKLDKVQTGWHKNRSAMASLLRELNNKFAGSDLYGNRGVDSSLTGDGSRIFDQLAGSQSKLNKQLQSLGTGEDVLARKLQGDFGESFEDYASGKNIDKYDLAKQSDVEKYNALQKLMGGEDIIDDTRRQTDFTKKDSIQALLDRYKNS